MPIQEGFAAALRLIRTAKGLKQKDLTRAVTGSHVSQLESGKTTPTLKAAGDLAQTLGLPPLALIAVAMACDSQVTPRAALTQAISDLENIGLADEIPPVSADDLDSVHPTSVRAAAIRAQVQELKSQGLKQVDVAKKLELPKSTVQRHWH